MARVFLFEGNFEIGRTSHIEVYRNTDNPADIKYECIIDKEECYELWRGHDGEWYDVEGRVTNMSDLLGPIVDDNYSAD